MAAVVTLSFDLLTNKSIGFFRVLRTTTVPSFTSFAQVFSFYRANIQTNTPTNTHTP